MIPKYVEGMLALCKYCGFTSIEFNRCQRCKRKFPDDVKSISVLDKKKKRNQASLGSKERLYPKPWVKLETSLEAAVKSSKRGRQPVKRNRKLVEEPVCLTLSSDEEDRSQSNDASMLSDRSASGQALLGDGAALVASDPAVTSSAMDKEPVIPDEDDCSEWEAQHSQGPGVRGGGRELDLESIIDGSMPGSYTLLQCRIVRIGSYKVVPRERVILSTIGIRIAVPSIEDETKSVTLWIDISEIRKVLIHFGRGLPVLFFYTMHAAANRVRESLKMESKEGPYYDPKSADDTQRRITLLPERLHVESKVALKNIFGSLENVFAELSNKEAKDILVRASPKEGGGGARVPQQRATQGPHVRHRHGPATHEEGAAARLPGRQRIAAGGLLQSDRSRELQSAQ